MGVPSLGRGGAWFPWASDAERQLSYMRNMRTVKVTYCGHIFFCNSSCGVGVSRRLGYPSGGL